MIKLIETQAPLGTRFWRGGGAGLDGDGDEEEDGDEDEDGMRVLGLQKWGPPQNGPKVKFH